MNNKSHPSAECQPNIALFYDLQLDRNQTCCFSGYRPHKFAFKLCDENAEYAALCNRLYKTLENLIKSGYKNFICGGAMGFDIVCAETVLQLKNQYPHIALYCFLPFKNQSYNFSKAWKERYQKILSGGTQNFFISNAYRSGCYQKRNKYMVDNSALLLTYFDGQAGGTAKTVAYAEKTGIEITNLAII